MKYIKLIYSMMIWIIVIGLLISLAYIRDANAYISDLENVVDDKCGDVADVIDDSRVNYYNWTF